MIKELRNTIHLIRLYWKLRKLIKATEKWLAIVEENKKRERTIEPPF